MTVLDRLRAEAPDLDAIELTPIDEALTALPDPYSAESYLEAKHELERLQAESNHLSDQQKRKQEQLDSLDVVDEESADQAAKLDRQIAGLSGKAVRLREAVQHQRGVVDRELEQAKRTYSSEAKRLWVDQLIPEIMEHLHRLLELRAAYKQLKGKSRHGMLHPSFPSAISGALGKDSVWLKARQREWFSEND